jgi:hypothetical protein
VQGATAPYAQSPIRHQEPTRPTTSLSAALFGVCSIPKLGLLTTSLAANTDIPVIERSWGLLSQIPTRKDQFYGPNFKWKEYFRARNWFHGVAVHWGLLVAGFMLACIPPIRSLMRKFVTQPGQGPTREAMEKEEVEYRGIAWPDTDIASNKLAFGTATFKGSMYYCEAPD